MPVKKLTHPFTSVEGQGVILKQHLLQKELKPDCGRKEKRTLGFTVCSQYKINLFFKKQNRPLSISNTCYEFSLSKLS